MSPSKLNATVVTDRLEWIERMLAGIRALPLDSLEDFTANPQTVAAAESYLRRALEALLDLGRHVLARGFGLAAAEYEAIARGLLEHGVLDEEAAELLRTLAGYRNRMVHFYRELSDRELYEICSARIRDLESARDGLLTWIREDPDRIDRRL